MLKWKYSQEAPGWHQEAMSQQAGKVRADPPRLVPDLHRWVIAQWVSPVPPLLLLPVPVAHLYVCRSQRTSLGVVSWGLCTLLVYLIFYLFVMCARACVCIAVAHMKVRKWLVEIYSPLPPYGFWGLNSGCRAQWQVTFLHWATLPALTLFSFVFFFFRIYFIFTYMYICKSMYKHTVTCDLEPPRNRTQAHCRRSTRLSSQPNPSLFVWHRIPPWYGTHLTSKPWGTPRLCLSSTGIHALPPHLAFVFFFF